MQTGNPVLLKHIHELVTLYKKRGVRNEGNDYCCISLLNLSESVFARVVLTCLQSFALCMFTESQYGFKESLSTVDMIFSIQ